MPPLYTAAKQPPSTELGPSEPGPPLCPGRGQVCLCRLPAATGQMSPVHASSQLLPGVFPGPRPSLGSGESRVWAWCQAEGQRGNASTVLGDRGCMGTKWG